jgi:hypothetical protein
LVVPAGSRRREFVQRVRRLLPDEEVEWIVEEMVQEPAGGSVAVALDAWRDLVDGPPRIARAAYEWQRAQ